jgi:hypothetical protein
MISSRRRNCPCWHQRLGPHTDGDFGSAAAGLEPPTPASAMFFPFGKHDVSDKWQGVIFVVFVAGFFFYVNYEFDITNFIRKITAQPENIINSTSRIIPKKKPQQRLRLFRNRIGIRDVLGRDKESGDLRHSIKIKGYHKLIALEI